MLVEALHKETHSSVSMPRNLIHLLFIHEIYWHCVRTKLVSCGRVYCPERKVVSITDSILLRSAVDYLVNMISFIFI